MTAWEERTTEILTEGQNDEQIKANAGILHCVQNDKQMRVAFRVTSDESLKWKRPHEGGPSLFILYFQYMGWSITPMPTIFGDLSRWKGFGLWELR
jgi:hypothetical protein